MVDENLERGGDILVPLQLEEKELAPYPGVEYKVIEASGMDKLMRDVNEHLKNGRQTEGGVATSVNGGYTKMYQALIRWNVDYDGDDFSNSGPETEMPSENSEAGAMGPNAPVLNGSPKEDVEG